MSRDKDLVFSTDGSHLQRCPRCGKPSCTCAAVQTILPAQTPLKIRLDKKGRGGKSVTLIEGLPHNPEYAAALLKKLKQRLGCGGTLKHSVLELQGDRRADAKKWLEGEGFPVTG